MKRAALLILLGGALLGLAAWPSALNWMGDWLRSQSTQRASFRRAFINRMYGFRWATFASWIGLTPEAIECSVQPPPTLENRAARLGLSLSQRSVIQGRPIYLLRHGWSGKSLSVTWALHAQIYPYPQWILSIKTSKTTGVSVGVHVAWLWTAGLLATGAGGASIVRTRRRRRARRGCCGHCGYDLSGLRDDARCPECGQRREARARKF